MLAVADIQVSTRDELPAEGEIVGDLILQPGSIAQIIQEGEFVTMDADFAWYPEAEEAASAGTLGSSSTPALTMGRPLLGDVPSVLVPNDGESGAETAADETPEAQEVAEDDAF
jgi:hypothetical protein